LIICGNCGTRNEDGTAFCGECGEFLEWTGTKTAVANTGDATQTATPTADPSTAPSTVERAAGTASGTAPVTGTAGPATGTAAMGTTATGGPATGGPTTGTAGTESERVFHVHPGPATTGPATATTGPDAVRQPPFGTPQAVQPGEEFTPTYTPRRHDDDEPNEGDLICGKCGTANVPTRKFCRRCGNELATAEVVEARLSWWRRLLNWLRGRRKRYEAGDRRQIRQPRGRGRGILLISAVLALVLVLVAALPARPLLNKLVTFVKDRTSAQVPVTPVAIHASSAGKGTPAGLVSDGITNKYWAPAGKPVGAWVEVAFAQPVRLLQVIVTPGISTEKDKFLTQGRPHELKVTASGPGDEPTTKLIQVRDEPGHQTFNIAVSNVTKVRFTIDSTYGVAAGKICAIGELEFSARG
jgi:hypothetical protein